MFICGLAFAQNPRRINDKDAFPRVGQVVSFNLHAREVMVKVDGEKAPGLWRLNPKADAFYLIEEIAVEEALRLSRKVRFQVSRDGEVERIDVLEWR
jgi:hypothetical protein